ncbi:hypothetical protein BHM03_00037285 [Ensete ventricosum]|nr:hypothetical protein BHM03_00037285 [Ensete ventricosum]
MPRVCLTSQASKEIKRWTARTQLDLCCDSIRLVRFGVLHATLRFFGRTRHATTEPACFQLSFSPPLPQKPSLCMNHRPWNGERERDGGREEELLKSLQIVTTLINGVLFLDTESGNDPPLWHAKFHESPLKGLRASSISTSKGSVFYCSYMLSTFLNSVIYLLSDNDDLIGKQNLAIKRQTLPKIKSINQSLQAQGKEGSDKNAGVGTPLRRKGISKESGNYHHANERKLPSEVAAQRQVMFMKRG